MIVLSQSKVYQQNLIKGLLFLDGTVQDYIKALRIAGGVVNTTIVMAAANGIVKAKDISHLASHGGNININKGWA